MPLRVAVQMDPLEEDQHRRRFDLRASCSSAQARGHQLYHYLAEDLTYQDGRLYAGAHAVTVQAVAGDHFRFGEFAILDLGRDVDVVLMRQDPPFDLGYITATHLLERIQGETLVVNDPAARSQCAREGVGARFRAIHAADDDHALARRSPASSSPSMARSSSSRSTAIAGGAVFRIGRDGANLASLMELFNATYREPHIVQKFLPEIAEGDKRIVLVDGEVAGAINRRPGRGRDPLEPRGRRQRRERPS